MLRASDLADSSLVWLLEVKLGGRVFRFSSTAIDVVKDGAEVAYPGGLDAEDIDYSEQLDRLGVDSTGQSASLEVVFPIDLAQARRRGSRLASATAELSLMPIREGAALQAWEGRHVVAVGPIVNAQIADPTKPSGWTAFTIDPAASEDQGRLLRPNERINEYNLLTTWETAADAVTGNLGKPYPIIIGTPGLYKLPESAANRACEGSPAYCVDFLEPDGGLATHWNARTLLIAGHHVSASHVTIYADGVDTPQVVVPENTYDRQGQPIAIVDLTVAYGMTGDTDFRRASQFWVGWGRSVLESTGAGLRNPYRPGDLIGAGDCIRWALSRSSLSVDAASWAAVAPMLNALVDVSTYINDPDCTPWQWLEEHLLGILPVSVRMGPRGLYPILSDIGRRPASTLLSLSQGREITRMGPLQDETVSRDIHPSVALEYAARASEGDSYQRIAIVGKADTSTGETSTVHTREGAAGYPSQEVLTLSTVVVYAERCAMDIARRMAREASRTACIVDYSARPAIGWLPVGSTIALTDPDLYMTDQPAEVIVKAWDGIMWSIRLLIYEDPARDDRG